MRPICIVFVLLAFLASAAFAETAKVYPPEVVADWCMQDGRTTPPDEAYLKSCAERREARLKTLKEKYPVFVFVKHYDFGGSHYTYTEGLTDAQGERHFVPGSSLCRLELGKSGEYEVQTLIDDRNGVIRDPVVSLDGKKVIFSWKKSDWLDDFHLYDYELASGTVRQLTFGLGYADYEPCVTPSGDIIFVSSRCGQIIDCFPPDTSNFYICDKDGNGIRRLGFDQVHTNWPTLTSDGRIIYTRWEYNDRSQLWPQPLFQMYPDGTHQTEVYGNNSYFPTSLMHTREIPNSGGKFLAIFAGHHTKQYGKIGIVDPSKGRQENSGAQLISPIRETPADRVDGWGQFSDRFAYPYPINESEYIISYSTNPDGHYIVTKPFGLFWVDFNGQRELLASDPAISCHQAVPVVPTNVVARPSQVNPELDYGIFTMQDVYEGPGLEGIKRGTAKKIRVVALDFRSTMIGGNNNFGAWGAAMVVMPIATGNGSWDVKQVLGETPIYEDGSASFKVPARTPVYFQVLDANGHCIQTMRSWSTLQPGETFSCIGCHENKNATAIGTRLTEAMKKGPQDLAPFYGEARGFSFAREIQPILDRHCIECHQNPDKNPPYMDAYEFPEKIAANRSKDVSPDTKPFSLKDDLLIDPTARRSWTVSYVNLTNSRRYTEGEFFVGFENDVVNWIPAQEGPELLPSYRKGAATSGLMKMFDPQLAQDGKTHNDVRLSREELEKIACWIDLLVPFCGDSTEANIWTPEEWKKFQHYEGKREKMRMLDAASHADLTGQASEWLKKEIAEIARPANFYRDLLKEANIRATKDPAFEWHAQFYKPARIDQLSLVLDYPRYGNPLPDRCTLECSNGFTMELALKNTDERQNFVIPVQEVQWIKLTKFATGENECCPLSVEVEACGIHL